MSRGARAEPLTRAELLRLGNNAPPARAARAPGPRTDRSAKHRDAYRDKEKGLGAARYDYFGRKGTPLNWSLQRLKMG